MSAADSLPGMIAWRWRVHATPIAATVCASALGALPVIANAPVLPPFGLLMALAWRLLRPEMWRAWVALPLGLADDLLTGQPLGIGMASWTLMFLAIDRIDSALPWRGYWLDWTFAAIGLAFGLAAGVLAAGVGPGGIVPILPQIAITIACFPCVARLAALLDRWRLAR